MEPDRMTKVEANGLTLQLAQWEGDGLNILGVHGLTANCRSFEQIAEEVSPKHNFLAMDLRGRGFSDKPEQGYSIPHHCRDIKNVLAVLDLSRTVIMGHSLGAAIALEFACRYPDLATGLILLDGGGQLSEEQMDKVLQGIRPTVERVGKVFASFEEYIEPLRNSPLLQPWNQALENCYRYEVQEDSEGVKNRIRPENIQEEMENLAEIDLQACYGKIGCPVLILRATQGMQQEDDLLLPRDVTEMMLQMIPDARVVDVPGTNHYTIVFQPSQDREKAIDSFLSEIYHGL